MPRLEAQSSRNAAESTNSSNKSNSHDSGYDDDVLIDPNFLSINIVVFRNGDDFFKGTKINVTRRQFKHWILFLDYLTNKLELVTPVNHLYTLSGEEVHHFRDLKEDGSYVAAKGSFKRAQYGKTAEEKKRFMISRPPSTRAPPTLDSNESFDLAMQRMGYVPKTNRAFPEESKVWDGPEHDLRRDWADTVHAKQKKRLRDKFKQAQRIEDDQRQRVSDRTRLPPISEAAPRRARSYDRHKERRFYGSSGRSESKGSSKRAYSDKYSYSDELTFL